jgi:hypothetical protein
MAKRRTNPTTYYREAKVLIGGHYPYVIQKLLKHIAIEERVTVKDLVQEGLDVVLKNRGKQSISQYEAALAKKTT